MLLEAKERCILRDEMVARGVGEPVVALGSRVARRIWAKKRRILPDEMGGEHLAAEAFGF